MSLTMSVNERQQFLAGVHVAMISIPRSTKGPFAVTQPMDGQLLAMAIRYLGEEQGRSYAEGSPTDEGSIVVSIKPETWYTVDYSKA